MTSRVQASGACACPGLAVHRQSISPPNLCGIPVQIMPPEVWCAWEAQHAAVARLADRGLEAAMKLEDVAPEWLPLAASMLPQAEVRPCNTMAGSSQRAGMG